MATHIQRKQRVHAAAGWLEQWKRKQRRKQSLNCFPETTSTMVSFRLLCLMAVCGLGIMCVSHAFVSPSLNVKTSTQLSMGLFDNWSAGGSGNSKEKLDEQWAAQQEILRNRRKPKAERDEYFKNVEKKRQEATKKQQDMWAWQTKKYGKGEDPLDEWKKRRESGVISDLDGQYGDEKKIGGIPLPMASFGVGGEFGVGGKYDNGGRFVSSIGGDDSVRIIQNRLTFSFCAHVPNCHPFSRRHFC